MSKQEKSDLAPVLNEKGLNVKYWLPKFNEKGLRIKTQLQYVKVDSESFKYLAKQTRFDWEENALQEIFNIDAEKLQHEKEQKKKESQQTLEEANKARLQEKESHDKQVAALESDKLQKLQTPRESWIPKDKSLDEQIRKDQEQLAVTSGQLHTGETFDDRTVLQIASGGKALQGVLRTKKLEDRTKGRNYLLRLPDTVVLTKDIKKDTKDIRCYFSHQENEYKKIVDALGLSAALSAKVPVHAGAVIGGDLALSSKREKEEEMKSHEGEVYSSTLRYRIVHIASYSFRNQDLQLSKDAREDLEKIVKIHNVEKYDTGSMKVKTACAAFFETYGSHVYRGPLKFGGHYYWRCFSTGFESTDEQTKKDMKARAASANVGAAVSGVGISAGGGVEKIKGSSEGEHSEDTNSSTFSTLRTTGGPLEANDLKTWEEGLSKYNRTWALIERGGEMIAVWDIILRSHKDEFGDIVEDLKNTWEIMTGLKAEEDISINVTNQDRVLKEISEWNEKDLTVDQMKENLERLLEIKRSILDKQSFDFWIHNYLTSSPIQKFFESVMNECQQCYTTELLLQAPLHNLVKPNELHRLKARDFPSIKPFSEWLFKSLKISSMQKECTSFENFDSLQEVLRTKVSKVKRREHHTIVFDTNPTAHTWFKQLDLCKHYPGKLGVQDALCIRQMPIELSLQRSPYPPKLSQLPYLILHKIMSYDCRSRSDLMPNIKSESSDESDDDSSESRSDTESDVDSDQSPKAAFLEAITLGDDTSSQSDQRFHPVDSLLALILCSDDFLRQDLFSRLAKCQLAVPFLIPDPFTKQLILPLWALRSIIKDWKCLLNPDSGEIKEHSCPIISYNMPIVSFIRFGKLGQRASKSELLNEVISGYDQLSHYDHFFHRDCPGGNAELLIGDGLVDMCWYLPAGKKSDKFTCPVTFLNLHGDARQYLEQTKILSQLSSMCFLFVNEKVPELDVEIKECLKYFSSSRGGLTILKFDVGSNKESWKKVIRKSHVIELEAQTKSEIKIAIQKRVEKKLAVCDSHTLEECSTNGVIRGTGVFIDESVDDCTLALSLANDLTCICEEIETGSTIKEAMLPLQSETLWQAWAAKDKERYRQNYRGTKTVIKYREIIDRERDNIRKEQLRCVKRLSPVMKSFIVSLLKLGGPFNKTVRNYYLSCLRRYLDNVSREKISQLQHSYQAAKRSSASIKKRKSKHKSEIDSINKEIVKTSFGLEHLLRELGQVYEAALQSSEYGEELSHLPKAVAQLLCDGYPVELMDGDAAHVPLKWISAVLNEAQRLLGDPKVFVLSVLGLQSTGKSTMLNTVFGLQFNVSAGRCTRGAFMQLIPLDEELKRKSKCGYILIVDTEGLRAPQFIDQSQKHDNELATFVIGLADMTLINLKSELPADIEDILQTSVHAFLRMKEVELQSRCQFIHQNTEDSIKLAIDRCTFTTKLDEFTVNAAKEEKCDGKYTVFNDVIKFNDQRDVHHFPGLWKGDPPMAHVNLGYSTTAQALKYQITQILLDLSFRIQKLSWFQEKLKHIWTALLKENFVFSFKNTLEIAAYNSLEDEYSKWDRKFHEDMLKWEQQVEHDINKADEQTLTKLIQEKRAELKVFVSEKLYNPLKSEMDNFFKSCKNREITAQWKARFELRLSTLSRDLTEHADTCCERLGKNREAIIKFETERKSYAAIVITNGVPELISKLQNEREKLIASLNTGKLEDDLVLVLKVLQQELFNPDRLLRFKEQRILTDDQVDKISATVKHCEEQMEDKALCLHSILFNSRILSKEEVNMILKNSTLSRKQLNVEFNEQWTMLMHSIPFIDYKVNEPDTIKHAVEQMLMQFVKTKGQRQMIETLIEKNEQKEKHIHFDLDIEVTEEHFSMNMHSEVISYQELFISLYSVAHEVERIALRASLYVWPHARLASPPLELHRIFSRVHGISAMSDDFTIHGMLHAYVQVTSDYILLSAWHFLQKLRRTDTDFKEMFVQDLLRLLEKMIKESGDEYWHNISHSAGDFTFTEQYKNDVYVAVCDYAIGVFEEMAESYKDRYDPRMYLENHIKGPLLEMFIKRYYRTATGEAIANTLCAYLEEPIQSQLSKTLCNKMIGQMKTSEHYFNTKLALKVKVLRDLHEQEVFEDYIVYILDVKKSLKYWLECYTEDYCDGKASSTCNNTRLQVAAKEEASRLIGIVEDRVRNLQVDDTCPGINWLILFCQDSKIQKVLGEKIDPKNILAYCKNIPGVRTHVVMNVEDRHFVLQIIRALGNLKQKLHASLDGIKVRSEMKHWNNYLEQYNNLQKSLIGCTAQCPFCGEQCDLTDPDHDTTVHKHRASVHRPSCLARCIDETTHVLSIDFCPAKVADPHQTFKIKDKGGGEHYYKDYQEVYPDWSIEPDPTSDNCLYWKSFVSKYNDALAKRLGEGLKPAEVPKEWSQIQWQDIERNLKSLYNL